MATYRYRAIRADGRPIDGQIDAADRDEAVASLRRSGAALLELVVVPPRKPGRAPRAGAKARAAARICISELAVLIDAGLQLDRALTLAIENVEDAGVAAHLRDIVRDVREGAPLSQAMARKPELFAPSTLAMTEAGEASGRLGEALSRLAAMLEQEAELRRLVGASMVYPVALLVIAVGVVLLMLLFVVPQFESMFASAPGRLPTATVVVMTASRVVRSYGLVFLLAGGVAAMGAAMALRRPAARLARDRVVLAIPLLGELVRRIDTARFARTLGALIDAEVALPTALALARRTLSNQVLGSTVARVAEGVKEGGGLTAPLAASGALPRLAIGFLRTGEETSQLGMMLARLADVLDRDIRLRIERLIGILTPVITVVLGATVASIIAAIMSAMLGFNDLALTP